MWDTNPAALCFRRLGYLTFALVIIVLIFSLPADNINPAQSGSQRANLGNPSAVYCRELGYQYQIIQGENGQYGVCHLPEGIICPAWDFLQGTCGQGFSHCATLGLEIQTRNDGKSPFSGSYGVCLTPSGQEVGTVVELSQLAEKATGCQGENIQSLPESLTITGNSYSPPDTVVPESFDWRDNNGDWMSPVKDQGACGSCWAFSAIGVTEAAINIKANNPALDFDLSEQYLISDCDSNSGNCCGGWEDSALRYIRDFGVPDEICMPYVDGDTSFFNPSVGCECDHDTCGNCTYNTDGQCSDRTCSDRCVDWESRSQSITSTGPVSSEISVIKQALINTGPLSAAIDMNGFFDGDIYRCTTENGFTDHAVAIVGYDDTSDYWIVRNSWGNNWNGDGYFFVGYGECSIEEYVNYVDASSPNTLEKNIIRVSKSSTGVETNGDSSGASISGDGSHVAFSSYASNLVSDDTNDHVDSFIHNSPISQTTRVSVRSDGTQAESWVYSEILSKPDVSRDGRYIVFTSRASDLFNGDNNKNPDVFRHDTVTGETILVSIGIDGKISTRGAGGPSISEDGRYVSFYSSAINLVADDTNGVSDIFVRDIEDGITSIVSLASNGTQSNAGSYENEISADGRFIVFRSYASNLIANDINGNTEDIFLHDRETVQTTLISVSSSGVQGNGHSTWPTISGNGRFIAYASASSNLVPGDTNEENDVFLHDTNTGITSRVSVTSSGEQRGCVNCRPSISYTGRYIAFDSKFPSLVDGDTCEFRDIFRHDTYTKQTIIVSINDSVGPSNGHSIWPSISADGRSISFVSDATNLVSDDNNGFKDIFLAKLPIFYDLPFSHWAYDYIESLYEAGFTSGYPDGTYRPENPVTRAEMAVFLLNGMGITPPTLDGNHPFSDIAGHWAEAYIEELYDLGITGGYPDGTYRPEALVTRAEMAVFLLNALGINPPAGDGSHPFSDIAGHWAESFIEELSDQGTTGGYPDGTYRPENRVTRAEMAVFLVNAFSLLLP